MEAFLSAMDCRCTTFANSIREKDHQDAALGKTLQTHWGKKPGFFEDMELRSPVLPCRISHQEHITCGLNARIQQQAIALRGNINYLDGQPPAAESGSRSAAADSGYNRAWEYWKQIIPVN
jgi:hypothetical protein